MEQDSPFGDVFEQLDLGPGRAVPGTDVTPPAERRRSAGLSGGGPQIVLWFSGLTRTADHQTYAVLFDGSVAGLSRGSAVQFNGIRVGEVTEINLVAGDPRRVEVLIQWRGACRLTRTPRRSLEVQGLTGGAAIALDRRRARFSAADVERRQAAGHRRQVVRHAEHPDGGAVVLGQGRHGARPRRQAGRRQQRGDRRRGAQPRHVLEGA